MNISALVTGVIAVFIGIIFFYFKNFIIGAILIVIGIAILLNIKKEDKIEEIKTKFSRRKK